jgi:hypothetical protein
MILHNTNRDEDRLVRWLQDRAAEQGSRQQYYLDLLALLKRMDDLAEKWKERAG